MDRIPVWIDCDPGVDDAAALLLAHALPNLEIVGISAVAGNVPLPQTTENALKLCDLMGAEYPVYAGAEKPLFRTYADGKEFHGENGLGNVSLPAPARKAEALPAWDGLWAAAERFGGALTLITMGPLTNIAIALAKYPRLAGKLNRILIMGGSATRGNRTPVAEYNIYADPEAAQAVLRCGAPIELCGLEVTEKAWLSAAELDALGALHTPAADFVRRSSAHILAKNLESGQAGWCIHDAVPVARLAHPELFSGRAAGVYVETQAELTRGKTVTDLYSDKKFEQKNAFVVLELERAAFVRLLTDALSAT